MKIALILTLTAALSGCASTYKGPQSGSLASLCRAEGHTMRTFYSCFENKLDKAQPGWREKDQDAWAMVHLIAYAKALSGRVEDGSLSDKDAFQMYKNENNSLVSQKNDRAYQASIERQNRSSAAIAAGALILSTQPRTVYQPAPTIPAYPSETNINVYQGRPYRFQDSSPYR